jgi:hypothetical protein
MRRIDPERRQALRDIKQHSSAQILKIVAGK